MSNAANVIVKAKVLHPDGWAAMTPVCGGHFDPRCPRSGNCFFCGRKLGAYASKYVNVRDGRVRCSDYYGRKACTNAIPVEKIGLTFGDWEYYTDG